MPFTGDHVEHALNGFRRLPVSLSRHLICVHGIIEFGRNHAVEHQVAVGHELRHLPGRQADVRGALSRIRAARCYPETTFPGDPSRLS